VINKGFAITVEDAAEMHEFKNSSAYGSYLKSIAASPAFSAIMQEHVANIDIAEDIKKLKNSGKLPDNVSSKALNELFKQSLARMAIGLVADSVILKELEDLKLEEVTAGLKEDNALIYLLGKGEKKYYDQAAKLVEEGKLDKNTIAFRGLLVYLKHNGALKDHEKELCAIKKRTIPKATPARAQPKKEVAPAIDLDSNDIKL